MATSNATPDSTPEDSPDGSSNDYVDPVAEAISVVIDPLIANAKVIAAAYAERTRLLAELDQLGHDRWIIAGLAGDPIESGRNDPDTGKHGPAWADEELARRALAAEVGCALRMNFQTAGMMICDAARLTEQLPLFHQALADGRIGWGHVMKLMEVTASLPLDLPDHVLPRLEEMTLTAAEKLTPGKFAKVARELLEALHPVPLQDRVNAGIRERRVVLRPDANGMSWLNAYLKADEAQAIYERLTQIAKAVNDDDTATPEPHPPTNTDTDTEAVPIVCRTRDQRRADAYRDLLLDGIGADGTLGRGIRGTVHITVPVLTLLGQSQQPAILDGYGPIDLETARRLTGTATSFTRILTHPHTGCTLSVDRDSHNPPADLRRYVQIRDNTCQAPGCNRQAIHSEIDHTQAWSAGGPTSAGNLVSLCRPDHRLKHQSSFTTRQAPDGTLTWTTPGGKTYTNPRAQDLVRAALQPPTPGQPPTKGTPDAAGPASTPTSPPLTSPASEPPPKTDETPPF
ncbi:HNH endonuclease signature motif containing protein [Cryobacterium sp. PAMC25264]|uniref:HNH endonuclease signature motif containing protein n=1 Tax=Cryobacterium sp. PAMC25264 TaxID=2861288 RepID=UPI001C62578F|nr:HNH endonuclease signature motif containing protein [Cryobacterium sp. PAMC25264]QYF74018.1 HNH endonuclease [Cryobacterium sp. PAMC25264]